MKDLILSALKKTVEQYPDIITYLKGDAKFYASFYALKMGEAPDDETRRRDEIRVELKMRRYLKDLQERIIEQLQRQYKSIQPSFWDDENQILWDELNEDFVGILIHGMDGALDLLRAYGLQDLIPPEIIQSHLIRYANQYRGKWLSWITETTRDFVDTSIREWLQSGDPLDNLIQTLSNPDLHIFDKARAKRIAVTEVTRLNALANKLSWEQSGAIREFKWQTANDELVCGICGPNNGKPFPLSELDSLIPAHVNCRCWGTPIVDIEAFGESLDFTPEPGESF